MSATQYTAIAAVLLVSLPAAAKTLDTLITFTQDNPPNGEAAIGIVAVSGDIFGSTAFGGQYDDGVFYKLNLATGTETVLHSFGGPGDGTVPAGPPVYHAGTFYGVTAFDNGAVYAVDEATGSERVLYNFPKSILSGYHLAYSHGLIYGTTQKGGASNLGAVYSIDPKTGTESTVYSFTGGNDGTNPVALTISGNTVYVGAAGTIDAINLKTRQEETLVDEPGRNLIVSGNTIYFDTVDGPGTIDSYDLATKTLTLLHGFTEKTDGGTPVGFAISSAGLIYGETGGGGPKKGGTLYVLDPSTGAFSVLESFSCAKGCKPEAPPIMSDGAVIGTTYQGKFPLSGTVFSYTP